MVNAAMAVFDVPCVAVPLLISTSTYIHLTPRSRHPPNTSWGYMNNITPLLYCTEEAVVIGKLCWVVDRKNEINHTYSKSPLNESTMGLYNTFTSLYNFQTIFVYLY